LSLDPRLTATAIEGALAAGRVHRTYFRADVEIRKKGPIDLVTTADLEAEQQFRRLIAGRFPDHVVLGEETRDDQPPAAGGFRWIIDPLDGTTNFAHGLALFCVSIALERDGRIDLGVVYDPVADELFTAERGEGARLNGRRVAVSGCTALVDGLLCTGFPYSVRDGTGRQVEVFDRFLRTARAVRRLGSAALDLCYVAAGRLDGFWEYRLHPWDFTAGALICEEAGGRVTDYAGRPLATAESSIVASNGALHADMLQHIRDTAGDASH
jgi:myo-inositol-1(or 4)-monophosphatase